MRFVTLTALLLTAAASSHAGDLDIRVLLSGQVAPGVYAQVQFGNAPPPPLVYVEPMVIEAQPQPLPPVYLHVPPGHARNWRKHCHEYHACNRPVYFVRSAEYEPDYVQRDREYDREREYDHDRGHGHGHGEGHGHGHDEDHDHHDRD